MNLSGIKKNARRSLLLTALLAACLGGLSSGALAQAWPGKPITIVSPYPAGGITDLLCRIVGEELAKVFGQPVLVENRLGAGGAIQVVAAALGLRDGVIPPTVNWQFPDPDCPLNLSAAARLVAHRLTLVNSHGLSGTNACLVLSK